MGRRRIKYTKRMSKRKVNRTKRKVSRIFGGKVGGKVDRTKRKVIRKKRILFYHAKSKHRKNTKRRRRGGSLNASENKTLRAMRYVSPAGNRKMINTAIANGELKLAKEVMNVTGVGETEEEEEKNIDILQKYRERRPTAAIDKGFWMRDRNLGPYEKKGKSNVDKRIEKLRLEYKDEVPARILAPLIAETWEDFQLERKISDALHELNRPDVMVRWEDPIEKIHEKVNAELYPKYKIYGEETKSQAPTANDVLVSIGKWQRGEWTEALQRMEAERRKRLGLAPTATEKECQAVEEEKRREILGLPVTATDEECQEAERRKRLGLAVTATEKECQEAERRKRLGLAVTATEKDCQAAEAQEWWYKGNPGIDYEKARERYGKVPVRPLREESRKEEGEGKAYREANEEGLSNEEILQLYVVRGEPPPPQAAALYPRYAAAKHNAMEIRKKDEEDGWRELFGAEDEQTIRQMIENAKKLADASGINNEDPRLLIRSLKALKDEHSNKEWLDLIETLKKSDDDEH